MIDDQSYRKSFYAALFLHVFLALLLLIESTNQRPALTPETRNELGDQVKIEQSTKPEDMVKAVSVDNNEVQKTMDRIKQERAEQIRQEQLRQQALVKQADMARRARLQEQQRLTKLKEEAEKLAIAKKKEIEKEQQRLKQLALQKEQEAKRIKELKNKQELLQKKQKEETEKLAHLKKQQVEEEAKQAKIQAEKARKELAEKQHLAAEKAAQDSAKQAKIAGEVDKYKAMIVNAISRQWILPENADSRLSSQFRIRLAPNGAVLEVSLMRSSGDAVLDRSAERAIYKASPLPVPTDSETFNLFRDISLTVRPENARG